MMRTIAKKMLLKSNNMRMAALIAAILLCCIRATAGNDSDSSDVARPVTTVFSVGVGRASVLDTYLTPVTYSGTHLRLGYSAMQATGFSPEKWVRHLQLGVEYGNVHNPTGINTMHALMVDGKWSLMHRWRMSHGLQLMAGGMIGASGGAIYNGQNSNNIVSVKAHIGLGLAGAAVYPVHIKRLPVTLSWQVDAPVIGAFYSLDYDESYYEIYEGNRSNLVHCTLPHRFELNSLVSADLHLGNTIVRVGYRFSTQSSRVCNISTDITSHSIVLGLGGDFLSVGKKPTPARTVTVF